MRDQILDFVGRWSEKTGIDTRRFAEWLGIASSKFYSWRERYGRVPRDFLTGAVGEGGDRRLSSIIG